MKIARHRKAFTLLEVIVGLVLMGSLVASALVALSSQRHSMRLAKTKREANQIAEKLLTNWFEVLGSIPTREQGTVEQSQVWVWRTYPIGLRKVCGFEANVIRLEVLGRVGSELKPMILLSLELIQSQNASGFR
jgi:prepilin-type N-terminal cleavage/methylation domain-containing protein